MLVNRSNLDAIFLNLKADFNNAFDGAPAIWPQISTLVPSTGAETKYVWFSRFPKMREWAGEKVYKQLKGFDYTLKNVDYEATVEVDRNDIEDDQLGQYGMQAQEAGYSAKQWPDELVMSIINNAFANLCYDGKTFCAANHPVGTDTVSSVSNRATTVLSMATLALAQASYGAARAAMRKFKDDEGRPLGIVPDTLLVPPSLEDTALVLLNNERLEDGKQNPYKGTAKLVVADRLTSDTAWFLLCTSRPIKPFVFQQRKAPTFVAQTDPNNPSVFDRRQYKFGAESRGAAGYTFWQLCYGSTGAG